MITFKPRRGLMLALDRCATADIAASKEKIASGAENHGQPELPFRSHSAKENTTKDRTVEKRSGTDGALQGFAGISKASMDEYG